MQDLDLGSSAPVLLPEITGSKTPYLAIQADKEGLLRLLNRQDLSGQGGKGHIGGELQTLFAPDHCPVLTQPAVWSDQIGGNLWVFVSNNCAISGYQVFTSSSGVSRLRVAWTVGVGATSPVIAGAILFVETMNTEVVALDPRTGHRLWGSAAAASGGSISGVHWESPIVVGSRLYCTDESAKLMAYSLP
jgi:outer membrane protein assembly factor BamB